MGRREKASAEKIRNGAGEEASSLSGESSSTHQGARKRGVGCVGGTDGEDPKMASGGGSGLQGAPNVDWCDQARVWSHAAATTSPRCAFKWFAHHLTARSSLRANPPSKSTVKAQFFGEQAARVSRQATRYALYCEATDNIDSSIKFQKFRSASPSFSKDGCTNRVKSVLRLAQRQNKLTLQFSTHR